MLQLEYRILQGIVSDVCGSWGGGGRSEYLSVVRVFLKVNVFGSLLHTKWKSLQKDEIEALVTCNSIVITICCEKLILCK